MSSKKLSDGVGKKIVEALKKQSEIEINTKAEAEEQEDEALDFSTLGESLPEAEENVETASAEDSNAVDSPQDDLNTLFGTVEEPQQQDEVPTYEPAYSQPVASTNNYSNSYSQQPNYQQASYQQQSYQSQQAQNDSFVSELDNFEIPNNISILKKLITQLPKGVTRHTGAQIIRQTMEALGISMKSVLQEAQEVQDGLSNSAKECQSTIQDYKKQIIALEKQSQNYQRQYAALNELISLFIQTGR
ncbi:hypothetical protein KBA27_04290 [bacterium]|nr:hypothetical protein [bacterium]